MNHVNWDTLSETERQFIHSFATPPDGSVIEQNGQPIARVLPFPKPNGKPHDDEWNSAKNKRRCDLIDCDIDGELTPDERVELEELQEQLRRFVNKVAPLPLEHVRKLHQELLEKAARSQAAG